MGEILILELIGYALSLGGALVACYGVHVNNQIGNHKAAMFWWGISNPALCIWSLGYILKLWDGSLPMLGLFVMYLYYSISNWLGRKKYVQ